MTENSLKDAFPSSSPSQVEVDEFRHAAGRGDKTAIAVFLGKYPAAIDSMSSFGDTALIYAVQRNKKEIVELLLDKGAIADASDKTGQTPLMTAIEYRSKDILDLLWEKTASDAAKKHRQAMHAALRKKKAAAPSLNQVEDFIDAASVGDIAAMTAFLDQHAAAVDELNADGQTALGIAVFKGQKSAVALLLDKGAQLEMRDSAGKTPLMRAAGEGHIDTVRLLREKGASLDVRNNKNETPLMWAALAGRTDVVQFLLEQGAAADAVDENGNNAQKLAIRHNQPQTADLIARWPEIQQQLKEQAQARAKQQAEEDARKLADANTAALDALRLEKLKSLRHPKPPFKKKM